MREREIQRESEGQGDRYKERDTTRESYERERGEREIQ